MWHWYQWLPRRWKIEQKIVSAHFADSRAYFDPDHRAVIEGLYPRVLGTGHLRERHHLRIVYPHDFLAMAPIPDRIWTVAKHPNVYLLSHHDRWFNRHYSHLEPQTADQPGWRMCLYVPGESGIDFRRPDSLLRLIEATHSHLLLQKFYQRDLRIELAGGPKAKWPRPDREHGCDGLLDAIVARGWMGPDEPCICGSARRFDACCKGLLTWWIQFKLDKQADAEAHHAAQSPS